MSINRITRERLFRDERVFNELLPYAKYDSEFQIFLHSDASLWQIFELQPQWITKTSDAAAFQLTESIQELFDSLEHLYSVQFNWVTTFEIEGLLRDSLKRYPRSGPAGWMAQRWIRSLRKSSTSDVLGRRPRRLRLLACVRFDPPWRGKGILQRIKTELEMIFKGNLGVGVRDRKEEYLGFANKFRGEINGFEAKLADLGFRPRRLDGQDLINILYPLLNRRSVKSGKFKRGKDTALAVPIYDDTELLSNQISETPAEHPRNGIVYKDGRVYRAVSMTKAPKQCLPLMITPLQSLPYENILSVTYSKDTKEKQMSRLDRLDSAMGFRERSPLGRGNQKVLHQISAIRAARQEIYNGNSQVVRAGVHQTFICQTEDEAVRASAEAISTFPQLNGARGMVHEISDLGLILNSLPGSYDPTTDGAGWTNVLVSSRAVRLLPLWGNWRGSSGSQIILPSLWNRELVGFDLYDSNLAPNVLISGVSGAGKSYLLCYLITTLNRGHYGTTPQGELIEKQPITFVFDKGMIGQPCGFDKLAKLFGGRVYEATPSKAPSMNFLSRLGETPPDARNEDFKDLVDMCSDIIGDMASEGGKAIDRLERVAIIDCVVEAHRIFRNGPMRRELILSDVVSTLRAPQKVDESEDNFKRRQRIALLIADYYGDGTYSRFFDRPGSLKLKERFIVFDLKALSRNADLQRVFLKVAMLWADTVMNDPNELDCRKILVFDEAHDLIGKTSAGTIETAFRLYRKRKGMVIAASQSGEDFYVGAGGQAIVQNSAHKIFLRQDPSKFHMTAQAFNLTEQQSNVIMRLRTIKGVESQFFLLSDIGEGALVLPLEPAFYWVSTNNGDDNQLFTEVLKETQDDFWKALEYLVKVAPNGAAMFNQMRMQNAMMGKQTASEVSKIIGANFDS